MRSSSEDLKAITTSKTDDDLYDVLFVHPQDYTPDAIKAAEEEFRHRNLNAPTSSSVVTVRKMEEAHLDWSLKILSFFISTAAFGIPVILAWRHFADKGERRKAHEWAQWAFFGFAFYLALFVIMRII
jgi:hypothetical protein